MKKTRLLLFCCFFTNLLYAQTNYYISPAGNNTNNGQLTSPWKTIQYAISIAAANDTLNILSGTYAEKINVNKSDIYIRNYSTVLPLLSGTGITAPDAMIQISGHSNVTIDGLEIANNIQNDAQGILVDGICANITIKNCIIHDIHFSANPGAAVSSSKNAQGIIVYGTNATTPISNLKIAYNKLYNCRLGYSEGIAVNGNVDGFEVMGNEVHDITNIGIDAIGHEGTCPNAANDQARNGMIKNNVTYRCLSAYASSGGLYVDGGKNIVIENNSSYHNGYGIEIGCENLGKTTDSIVVRNNIFYDNEICAIALGGYAYPSGSGKVTNCSVSNNTCFKNNYTNNGNGELYLSYSENSIIENNIFYISAQNILSYAELGQPSLHFDYNVFFSDATAADMQTDWNGTQYNSFAAFKTGTATNSHSIFASPQFVNGSVSNPDFHLTVSSAAKDAGNPSFLAAIAERDMDNEMRVNGIVDCGADEYYSTATVYTFTGNGLWSVAANWAGNIVPPAVLTGNSKIIINPAANGECILDAEQHISSGSQLIIQANKKLRLRGNMTVNN